jgi:hypothetical protein
VSSTTTGVLIMIRTCGNPIARQLAFTRITGYSWRGRAALPHVQGSDTDRGTVERRAARSSSPRCHRDLAHHRGRPHVRNELSVSPVFDDRATSIVGIRPT